MKGYRAGTIIEVKVLVPVWKIINDTQPSEAVVEL